MYEPAMIQTKYKRKHYNYKCL